MAVYKCLECRHIFEDVEAYDWVEPSGERFTGCPVCFCAYGEAYQCNRCGSYHLPDELYEGMCLECLKELSTPQNIADWCETDTLLAEQFYVFYYDSLIADSSEQLRQLLRGGLLQRYALDKLSRKHETADKCFEFVNDSDENRSDFAKWLRKERKNDSKT